MRGREAAQAQGKAIIEEEPGSTVWLNKKVSGSYHRWLMVNLREDGTI